MGPGFNKLHLKYINCILKYCQRAWVLPLTAHIDTVTNFEKFPHHQIDLPCGMGEGILFKKCYLNPTLQVCRTLWVGVCFNSRMV